MSIVPIDTRRIAESKVHLSFRDILLVPYDEDFCSIKSRKDPDISTEICDGKPLPIPLVSAPMDTITSIEMCVALDNLGCLGIHTRYINDPEEQTKQIKAVKKMKQVCKSYVSCAVGVRNKIEDHVKSLCDVGLDIICIDIANGNHILMKNALDQIAKFKDAYNLSVIAGNVCTKQSAIRLAEHGACALKIGVGPGAVCSTRRVTGFGVPQLTAILDCAEGIASCKSLSHVKIIADGGIRHPSDVVKSLWAGADCVMAGYVFAGHDECPNSGFGKRQYRGMSSRLVSGRDDVAAEGVAVNVENKGSVVNTVMEYSSAIKSALSMGNANNLKELRENVYAIRVSTVTHEESDPVRCTPC